MLASAGYSFRVPVSKSTFSVWDILCSPVQWSIRRCMRIRRRNLFKESTKYAFRNYHYVSCHLVSLVARRDYYME